MPIDNAAPMVFQLSKLSALPMVHGIQASSDDLAFEDASLCFTRFAFDMRKVGLVTGGDCCSSSPPRRFEHRSFPE